MDELALHEIWSREVCEWSQLLQKNLCEWVDTAH